VPFLPGDVASQSPPTDPAEAAVRLGEFLGALHVPAVPDAPANPSRGVPLADRRGAFFQNPAIAGGLVDDDHLWQRARGWAVVLSLAFVAHSADNPQLAEIGHRILNALLT
jgi:hypothetical protein